MKICNVTNVNSKEKYKIVFNLHTMNALVYDNYNGIAMNKDAKSDETVDDFVKRIKKEVKNNEDL